MTDDKQTGKLDMKSVRLIHGTRLFNLESILEEGGLVPFDQRTKNNVCLSCDGYIRTSWFEATYFNVTHPKRSLKGYISRNEYNRGFELYFLVDERTLLRRHIAQLKSMGIDVEQEDAFGLEKAMCSNHDKIKEFCEQHYRPSPLPCSSDSISDYKANPQDQNGSPINYQLLQYMQKAREDPENGWWRAGDLYTDQDAFKSLS